MYVHPKLHTYFYRSHRTMLMTSHIVHVPPCIGSISYIYITELYIIYIYIIYYIYVAIYNIYICVGPCTFFFIVLVRLLPSSSSSSCLRTFFFIVSTCNHCSNASLFNQNTKLFRSFFLREPRPFLKN